MINTLDRVIEEKLASLIDSDSIGIQCVPNLLAGGEANAVLPRVVVKCTSKVSPEFQSIPDGVYGVKPVEIVISSMAEATHTTSSLDMEEMNSAVDAVTIYNGNLVSTLTFGALKVFGVVPTGCIQERLGNRIIRNRNLMVFARLQPITSEQIITEAGEEILTEGGIPIYTE